MEVGALGKQTLKYILTQVPRTFFHGSRLKTPPRTREDLGMGKAPSYLHDQDKLTVSQPEKAHEDVLTQISPLPRGLFGAAVPEDLPWTPCPKCCLHLEDSGGGLLGMSVRGIGHLCTST